MKHHNVSYAATLYKVIVYIFNVEHQTTASWQTVRPTQPLLSEPQYSGSAVKLQLQRARFGVDMLQALLNHQVFTPSAEAS